MRIRTTFFTGSTQDDLLNNNCCELRKASFCDILHMAKFRRAQQMASNTQSEQLLRAVLVPSGLSARSLCVAHQLSQILQGRGELSVFC